MAESILRGIRVIDWSQVQQGPEAGALLGDLGADVIHVEQLGVGDQFRQLKNVFGIPTALPHGRHACFEYFNRNKRGLAIDLKNPLGREAMHRLVRNCDVFVTNYMPAVIRKLGLDYATLSQINSRLVYGSATMAGDRGPGCDMPGFDQDVLAHSGLLMATGDASTDGPAEVPVGMADSLGGFVLGTGIIAALVARERFGRGQEVKTSGLGALMKLMSLNINLRLLAGSSFPRLMKENFPATSRSYRCKDGRWIQLSLHREKDWGPLCRALGRPELENDPEFAGFNMTAGNPRLFALLTEVFATRPRDEWLAALREERLPHGAVNTVDDLESDPMVLANDYIFEHAHPDLGKIKYLGFPWTFSETPAQLTRPAPHLGEHSEEVLAEIAGYTSDEIARLREHGAI